MMWIASAKCTGQEISTKGLTGMLGARSLYPSELLSAWYAARDEADWAWKLWFTDPSRDAGVRYQAAADREDAAWLAVACIAPRETLRADPVLDDAPTLESGQLPYQDYKHRSALHGPADDGALRATLADWRVWAADEDLPMTRLSFEVYRDEVLYGAWLSQDDCSVPTIDEILGRFTTIAAALSWAGVREAHRSHPSGSA
ncbi:hypothetical protein AYO39_01595 [Actinobacteria bacterium SCGC AG-212-D09]|nr:hypothetical protein AYO39_01595 [Actinobacteria bacterium SCGC AG-212-D09]